MYDLTLPELLCFALQIGRNVAKVPKVLQLSMGLRGSLACQRGLCINLLDSRKTDGMRRVDGT